MVPNAGLSVVAKRHSDVTLPTFRPSLGRRHGHRGTPAHHRTGTGDRRLRKCRSSAASGTPCTQDPIGCDRQTILWSRPLLSPVSALPRQRPYSFSHRFWYCGFTALHAPNGSGVDPDPRRQFFNADHQHFGAELFELFRRHCATLCRGCACRPRRWPRSSPAALAS